MGDSHSEDDGSDARTNTRRATLKTIAGAGLAVGVGGVGLAAGAEHDRTVEWSGNGSEHATQDCGEMQGYWHWILTPGGSTALDAGARLTVTFQDGSETTVAGERRGGGGGALHFDVTKAGGGTVTSATVTFTGGGRNPVLTISDGECRRGEHRPKPRHKDLVVTQRCLHGNGVISVANDNDRSVSVTITGPGGDTETKSVPAGGSVGFGGLANGSYQLETDDEHIGVDTSPVVIDY